MTVLIDIAIGSAAVAGIVALIEATLALQARRRRAAPARRTESPAQQHTAASTEAQRQMTGASRARE